MIDSACNPLNTGGPLRDSEPGPDRLAELLASTADLLVQVHEQRREIAQRDSGQDARVREAIERLERTEAAFKKVGIEAASTHQLLQHLRLI
jgi:hypothetical protein